MKVDNQIQYNRELIWVLRSKTRPLFRSPKRKAMGDAMGTPDPVKPTRVEDADRSPRNSRHFSQPQPCLPESPLALVQYRMISVKTMSK
jgi:hypothetical protein